MDEASENAIRAMDTYGGTIRCVSEEQVALQKDGTPLLRSDGRPFDPPLAWSVTRLVWTPPPKETQP